MLLLWEMVCDSAPREKRLCKVLFLMGIAVVVCTAFADVLEMKTGVYRKRYFESWRKVVLNYKTASDSDLANPHFGPDRIRAWAHILDEDHLGPFANWGESGRSR
jgi:hypothetical protein